MRPKWPKLDTFVADSSSEATASPKPSPGRPVCGRLDSLPRCRKELVKLYRETRHGELEPQTATRLAHIIGLIATLLRDGALERLEQRVQALEAGRTP